MTTFYARTNGRHWHVIDCARLRGPYEPVNREQITERMLLACPDCIAPAVWKAFIMGEIK